MSRSVILGVMVSMSVFLALLNGEVLVILVALIGGYLVHTLLTQSHRFRSCSTVTALGGLRVSGAECRSRTCDLRFRRPTLYPAELIPREADEADARRGA